MIRNISDPQLHRLSEWVVCHLGLYFPQQRWVDLERGVCAAAEECGYQHELENYFEKLLSSALTQNQVEILASHLTIGETYFFREKRSLEILEQRILPDLIRAPRSGQQLKIWSAGCSTGEEPYSVAMALNKFSAALKNWNIEILATDLNIKSLQKASQGIYSEWSFRGTPPWARRTYFEATADGRWAIVPAIKKMVRFAPLNLMDDAYPLLSNCPNSLDVIFCRNVLMYFTREGMSKVIRQFYRYLAADGWLIVSPTETSCELFSDFATVSLSDATLYRKSDKRLPVTSALPACDEPSPSIQPPPCMVEATRPLEASICYVNSRAQATDSVPVSVELPAPSYREALVLFEQGRYEEAKQTTEGLLALQGSDAQAMFLLARIHANRGKLAEALGWCDKAIAADKMVAQAHYLRATILQEQSSVPEAILALKQAVYVEPQFVLGHFALGNLTLKHGKHKESEKHFENVLLLLARYEPEGIVPESEGLTAGRLREMIAAPSTLGVATQTSQARIRPAKQSGSLELSGR